MGKVTDPALLQQLGAPTAQPRQQPVLASPPVQPDPYQVQKDQFQQGLQVNQEARSQEDQALQRAKFQQDQEKFALDKQKLAIDQEKVSVEQGKAGSFALRARDALGAYDTAGLDPDSMIGQTGNQMLPRVTASFSSDKRNAVRAAEREFIAAVLRYDSGAAIPPAEFESAYLTYFPNPDAGPEEIAQKKRARETALRGLLIGAGPAVNKFPDAQAASPETAASDEEPFERDQQGNIIGLRGSVTDDTPDPDREKAIAAAMERQEGVRSFLAPPIQLEQGATFGLSDEAAGIGNAIGGLLAGEGDIIEGYQVGRDAYRRRLDQARQRNGWAGGALEIAGGFAGLGAGGVNALLPTTAGQAFRQGAVPGAIAGAVGGFGYGEGFGGSVGGAALGGATGGVLGGGLNALAPAASRFMASRARPGPGATQVADGVTAADVAAAGQAEGIAVPRMMVDPASRNRVIGVEKSQVGGPRIQAGVQQVEDAIQSRSSALGGGTAMETNTAGQTVQGAGKRFIEQSGKSIGRMYDRAVQAAGGVKVKPIQANQVLDDAIGRLSQTPGTNSAEIAYLQTLKDDLSKPLGVEALRDLRTTLRKKISKGELVFGQNEARVLGVMDALSQDIVAGLNSVGKGGVAKAFQQADNLYRQRMEFIQGTVQKLIGKRDATIPPGQVYENLKAMATPKGDNAGLAKMLRAMTPDERADIATTFAEALGKNGDNNFTVDMFVKQASKLPQAARVTLFGQDGAQSLANLETIAKALKAVPRGGSPTGAATSYQGWLASTLFGGGSALGSAAMTGSVGTGALTGVALGATAAGAKAARDILNARALLSPKITRWIATAPRTSNPQVIDAHFKRLGAIAAQEPALAGEIQMIQQRLMDAARQSPSRAAADDNEQNAGPVPVNQR